MTNPPIPDGWYDDPNDATQYRYWANGDWTDHVEPKPRDSPSPGAHDANPGAHDANPGAHDASPTTQLDFSQPDEQVTEDPTESLFDPTQPFDTPGLLPEEDEEDAESFFMGADDHDDVPSADSSPVGGFDDESFRDGYSASATNENQAVSGLGDSPGYDTAGLDASGFDSSAFGGDAPIVAPPPEADNEEDDGGGRSIPMGAVAVGLAALLIVGAIVAILILSLTGGDDGDDDEAPTIPSFTVTTVEAGPTTTVPTTVPDESGSGGSAQIAAIREAAAGQGVELDFMNDEQVETMAEVTCVLAGSAESAEEFTQLLSGSFDAIEEPGIDITGYLVATGSAAGVACPEELQRLGLMGS